VAVLAFAAIATSQRILGVRSMTSVMRIEEARQFVVDADVLKGAADGKGWRTG
jgi:hypothetical protein